MDVWLELELVRGERKANSKVFMGTTSLELKRVERFSRWFWCCF